MLFNNQISCRYGPNEKPRRGFRAANNRPWTIGWFLLKLRRRFFLNINYCNLKRNEIDDHEMCSLSICQQPLPHSLTALLFTHICYSHFQTSFIWKIRKIIKFLIEMTCESITVVMQRFSTIDNKNDYIIISQAFQDPGIYL